MPANSRSETIAAIEHHLAQALMLADAENEPLIAALIEDARAALLSRATELGHRSAG